jgi:hypothetical protein
MNQWNRRLKKQKNEEESEESDHQRLPNKKNKLQKYFTSSKGKVKPKPTKGGGGKGLQKMMEGRAIQIPVQKLKFQAHKTNKSSNRREEENRASKKPETTTMSEQLVEELQEEIKTNNCREKKKDNAFYGITVHIMDFLNRLTAASSWSTNPANTKASIHKMTKMIESFPFPVEDERIKLTELLQWKRELEKVTKANELPTKSIHKEKSPTPTRKEWDSSTTVPPEKPLKFPKAKGISTLTSPTGGSGIEKSD